MSPHAPPHDPNELVPDPYVPSFKVPPHPLENAPIENAPKQSRCRRALVPAVLATVVIGTLIGCVLFFTGKGGAVSDFIMEDPPGKDEVNEWSTNGQPGGGLTLFIMNSLEDHWTPIFDEYIQRWDNGDPDALTLTSRKYAHDPECDAHDGRINVCNGDYGNTNWRGVNTAFLRNGYVVNSVCKLNDHHLNGGSEEQRRYTMCHELGHAFGLPHTDTNYYNFDRGDCLDYTMRPRNNLDPGTHNFNLLFELYGSVGTGSNTAPRANDGDRQLLEDPSDTATPDTVLEKYSTVVACLETMTCSECLDAPVVDGGVRMLHESEQGEACEFNLGDGYTVQTHKLLVS